MRERNNEENICMKKYEREREKENILVAVALYTLARLNKFYHKKIDNNVYSIRKDTS